MRYALRSSLIALAVAGTSIAPTAQAQQFSLNISTPNVQIGINVPAYPNLVVVPGYPVYYAPQLPENYFFYDGLYWVYANDGWYCSDWYNGPWSTVAPEVVPDFILRVPVRYYRVPPPYFRGWSAEAPPRWGEHWGPTWQQRRAGWDRRTTAPPPAPLPTYQRAYSGSHYPSVEEQRTLHVEKYRYQPHEAVVREAYAAEREHRPAARNEPPGQREQGTTEQRDQQQRQAAQQRAPEHKDSKSEAQRRDAERRDEQKAAQQRAQQHRDAEQRPQAAHPREPQRKEAEHEQQQRQAAQQQREQQQHQAAQQQHEQQQRQAAQQQRDQQKRRDTEKREQQPQASREAPVQTADRSERSAPRASHPREEPRKKVESNQNPDDESKGNHK